MRASVSFVDRNPDVVRFWCRQFEDVEGAPRVVEGDVLAERADALVVPGNAFGFLDRGLELALCEAWGFELQDRIRRIVREEFRGEPFYLRQIYVTCMESDIAQPLVELLEEFPELMLGSYPRLTPEGYHTLLTLESREEAYVNRAVDSLVARIPASDLLRVE